MIRIEEVSKTFGKTIALKDISLQLDKGRSIAFIGPNGSGKTTLIKCILGLVRQDEGRIWVNDEPTQDNYRYREHIGYMPQVGRYPDNMKVHQVLSLIRQIRHSGAGKALDETLLETFDLHSMMDKPMHALSSGMRQKVSAVLAFLFDPPILILDEPTAGLDPLSNEVLKEKIQQQRERGKLILLTSHILSDLDDITSDVLYIQEGEILFFKSLGQLKTETDAPRLSKAITQIMKREKPHG
jgi:Cu-processing system ATP-binding protein